MATPRAQWAQWGSPTHPSVLSLLSHSDPSPSQLVTSSCSQQRTATGHQPSCSSSDMLGRHAQTASPSSGLRIRQQPRPGRSCFRPGVWQQAWALEGRAGHGLHTRSWRLPAFLGLWQTPKQHPPRQLHCDFVNPAVCTDGTVTAAALEPRGAVCAYAAGHAAGCRASR